MIFITENDVLKDGRPLYHIERTIDGGKAFGDESHIIYVNGSYQDEASPVGRLMHDFSCRDANSIHSPVLRKRTKHFKEDAEGVTSMCKVL